jgi:hypothetical protein
MSVLCHCKQWIPSLSQNYYGRRDVFTNIGGGTTTNTSTNILASEYATLLRTDRNCHGSVTMIGPISKTDVLASQLQCKQKHAQLPDEFVRKACNSQQVLADMPQNGTTLSHKDLKTYMTGLYYAMINDLMLRTEMRN